jgi:hypothetical protein
MLALQADMRVTGPFDANARGGLKALVTMPRRCEKPSASSALGREQQNLNDEDAKTPQPLQIELVCQEETRNFEPFWDGPRLLPTFVAQLMGQASLERRDADVSVETAYGSAAPRKALLLDRKS